MSQLRKMRMKQREENQQLAPDIWTRIMSVLGVMAWSLLLPILYMLDFARPRPETFFDRMLGLEVSSVWDYDILLQALWLLLLMFFLAGLGVAINHYRKQQRGDYYRFNLFTAAGIALLGCLYVLLVFVLRWLFG